MPFLSIPGSVGVGPSASVAEYSLTLQCQFRGCGWVWSDVLRSGLHLPHPSHTPPLSLQISLVLLRHLRDLCSAHVLHCNYLVKIGEGVGVLGEALILATQTVSSSNLPESLQVNHKECRDVVFAACQWEEDIQKQDLVAPDDALLLGLLVEPTWPLVLYQLILKTILIGQQWQSILLKVLIKRVYTLKFGERKFLRNQNLTGALV
ncbi:hypothetical protein E2C01_023126 [Portunus trituberculatus]|uniref:Uncharacterized protein n=1 Tax=Portunus trituberculatus TaxID=210409 RepID=A0A5B7EAQ4_PORTR|nr:hypothetical protein [Portunus trituberculatus]